MVRGSRCRRMRPGKPQDAAEIDQVRTIQPQPRDRGPTGSRPSFDPLECVVPREVFVPALLARIEQRDGLAGVRIHRLGGAELVVVAALAGEREVRDVIVATRRFRHDVIDGKRIRGKPFLAAAILAASPGALRHQFTQFGARRHVSRAGGAGGRVRPSAPRSERREHPPPRRHTTCAGRYTLPACP